MACLLITFDKMLVKGIVDLHLHLNGSYSMDFLEKTAIKNKCHEKYVALKNISQDYLTRTNVQPETGFSIELIDMVWQQFKLIHEIVQSLDDIYHGVLDVVQHSNASYLEIRTTPKCIGNHSEGDYIHTFKAALLKANELFPDKRALGLLSLDRVKHTITDTKRFLNYIVTDEDKILVGLDISGNPIEPRQLTGDTLQETVNLCLEKGIGIAIHMAESDTDIEKADTDIVLKTLEEWQLKNGQDSQQNPMYEKVRLGHCIYLTEEQQKRIAKIKLPIELCFTCHKCLNWHIEPQPHPVSQVYSDLSDPLVLGTDDKSIFGASIQTEFTKMFGFFSNKEKLNIGQIIQHQASFKFER